MITTRRAGDQFHVSGPATIEIVRVGERRVQLRIVADGGRGVPIRIDDGRKNANISNDAERRQPEASGENQMSRRLLSITFVLLASLGHGYGLLAGNKKYPSGAWAFVEMVQSS